MSSDLIDAIASAEPGVERLRKLSEINRALTYTTTWDQAARLAVERGAALLDAAAAVLMLPDSGGLLHVRAAHGIAEDRVSRFRAPMSDELIGRLQGLLAVPDENFIAVPLVVGGAVTGLIAVALSVPSTAADEWLLSALADQVAVALENARLGGEVRVEMEDRLAASEAATNAKDRALSTLAHDIRTPLGAIEGYCELLEDQLYGPINERQREALGRVRMSGRHLLSLLDNVMDMARLNAGIVTIKSEPVRLSDIARETVDMLAPAAHAKLQRLKHSGPADLVVAADGARVRQILVNLVGNAVKFTPHEGAIDVIVSKGTQEAAAWGEIRVVDTGPGIAPAEREVIFEPYYRSANAARAPGVGLGLAISHALAKQMGGDLTVEGGRAAGSTFVLRLPCHSQC